MTRVLIVGGGQHNSGAELMVTETVRRIRMSHPEALVTAPYSPRDRDLYLRLGMREAAWAKRGRYRGRRAPRWLLNMAGGRVLDVDPALAAPDGRPDLVVDVSGFAYGDPWPARTLSLLAVDVTRWARHGSRVVFAPQSFGPFTGPRGRIAARALERAAKVTPRDLDSADRLRAAGYRKALSVTPDLVLGSDISADSGRSSRALALVPSAVPIQRGLATEDALADVYTHAAEGFDDVRVVQMAAHDGGLARSIADRLGVDVVEPTPATGVVDAVTASTHVLTGRYHGAVVGSRAGCVVVSLGWSHKYRSLVDDVHGGSTIAVDEALCSPQTVGRALLDTAPVAVPEGVETAVDEFWASLT